MSVATEGIRTAPIGTASLGAGIIANLVAVIGLGAAGFVWVGRIDTKVDFTREELRSVQSREQAIAVRVSAAETVAAGTAERLRGIEQTLAEIKLLLREQSGAR